VTGIVVWALVVGAVVALELVGFVDGAAGWPTASQLVKRWRGRSRVRVAVLTAALVVAPVVLWLHLVAEAF
jgi:hypothetical protein